MNNSLVVDGANAILGRLASFVAKQALLGKTISVVNCDKVVISGNRRVVLEGYKEIRAKGGSSLKGPLFPTKPAAIVKRTIRGMLSHKQRRGATALKKIKCYEGLPKEYLESKIERAMQAKGIITISLKEISEELR
jgi:large subunit ribosomal protein L13